MEGIHYAHDCSSFALIPILFITKLLCAWAHGINQVLYWLGDDNSPN